MINELGVYQLKKTLDYIFDGNMGTVKHLMQINALFAKAKSDHARTAEHRVYLWLVKNQMKGHRFIEFFEGEGGFLGGINYIMNSLAGRKIAKQEIKISDFL